MGSHLTAAQRALLDAELQQRQREIAGRLSELRASQTQVAEAAEVMAQDVREAAQREGERGIDLAISELEQRELALVSQALARLREGEHGRYGRCIDCDGDIPFQRLQAEPQALRCIACEAAHETAARRGG